MANVKNLTGQIFGKLTALYPCGKQGRNILWMCVCECGKENVVAGYSLTAGTQTSCGCMRGVRHGMHGSREYVSYQMARNRCLNPKFTQWKDYGGRGIKFLFASFEDFFAHAGTRPVGTTLDRIDNDGNYEVGNVRWATPKQQSNNRKRMPLWCKVPFTLEQVRSWRRAA